MARQPKKVEPSDALCRGCDSKDLPFFRSFPFLQGSSTYVQFLAVLDNDGIEFLLDFPQKARRIDARKITVDMLVNDFDESHKFSHRQVGLHLLAGPKCTTVRWFFERCL